jgi:ribosomal protein S9
MDLRMNTDQKSVVDALGTLFRRSAGPTRARALADGTDAQLAADLLDRGYLGIADGGGQADYLTAALVTEEASRLLVSVPVGARALVCPCLGIEDAPALVGLASSNGALVRHGSSAGLILMLDGDVVRVLDAGDVKAEPVSSRATYPLARVTALPGRGRVITDPGAVARMTRSWRTTLAAEIAGAMAAAIEVARAHVSVRTQFGRHIGSFQAVQHGLAQAYVHARASTWLARKAAWEIDSDLPSALAAAYATAHAHNVFDAVHQVVGAVGFTTEFDLHLWSLRLPALAAEFGGPASHAAAASRLKWPVAAG